ncbi:response regulator transcription factor [Halapricum hydrolyticum]|uniref:HalX domain-containing protein n=1 Tax=Halapricum hydrolyticum TaxID=2979991 RepID=A0AAE3I9Z6_9EURY|nr:response regulator transcription factor [Halapricum hydrolyticum]MCU4717234.1 HalX domain-containing protein [Halapricum hydrolyticum]MCU4726161.1 HalX domain-containing protein [Halapricum hydrolyticum]
MPPSDTQTVLVVDDEPDVADAYAAQLREKYAVRTAYGGQGALDAIDETIDVVLLDRRMPEISGDEVLRTLRSKGIETRVAMVTAVDPDFDIIEMPFDDYLTKPVSRSELFETVDRLLTCAKYDAQFQEFYSLTSKLATLQANKSQSELENSEEYVELTERREAVRERLDETLSEFNDDAFAAMFRELNPNPPLPDEVID